MDKAYVRAEEAYHEVLAAQDRQQKAREQYHEAAAKIDVIQAQSDAIREAQKAEEAEGTPPEKIQYEQMRLSTVPTAMRTMFEDPLLDNEVKAQMQSQQEAIERCIKANEMLAALYAQGQASIAANKKRQKEEAEAAAVAPVARQQFIRATAAPPEPTPTGGAQPTVPTTTAGSTAAAAAATGGGSKEGEDDGKDKDKKDIMDESEEEEEDDDEENTSKDDRMQRGAKGLQEFSIADDVGAKRLRASPTREDILGTS